MLHRQIAQQMTDNFTVPQTEKTLLCFRFRRPLGVSGCGWQRRRNLNGRTFSAISQTWSPFVTSMSTSPDGQVSIEGMYADVADTLAPRLNVSFELMPNDREEWDHLVKEVSEGGADVGLTGFSHTFERM